MCCKTRKQPEPNKPTKRLVSIDQSHHAAQASWPASPRSVLLCPCPSAAVQRPRRWYLAACPSWVCSCSPSAYPFPLSSASSPYLSTCPSASASAEDSPCSFGL